MKTKQLLSLCLQVVYAWFLLVTFRDCRYCVGVIEDVGRRCGRRGRSKGRERELNRGAGDIK
jgi:hypothetical protein